MSRTSWRRERLEERFPRHVAMPPPETFRSNDPEASPGMKLAQHVARALGIAGPLHPNDFMLARADYGALLREVERWLWEHAVLRGPGGVVQRGRGLTRAGLQKAVDFWSLDAGPMEDVDRVGIMPGLVYVKAAR